MRNATRRLDPSRAIMDASTINLLRYIEEDVAALRYCMETGRYPDGISYDKFPTTLIVAYATELKRRGY